MTDTIPWLVYAIPSAMLAQLLVGIAALFPPLLWRFPPVCRITLQLRPGIDIYSALSGYYTWQRPSSSVVNLLNKPVRLLACTRLPKRKGYRNPAVPLILISSIQGQGVGSSLEVRFVPYSLPVPLIILLGLFCAICFRFGNPPLSRDETLIDIVMFISAITWMLSLAFYIQQERRDLRALLSR